MFIRIDISKLLEKLTKNEKIIQFFRNLRLTFLKFKGIFSTIFILTLLNWIIGGIAWATIGLALKINLPLVAFILLNPIVSSLSFFPLTLNGIGITEVGNIMCFSLFNIQPEKAFLFIILERFIYALIGLLGLRVLLKSKYEGKNFIKNKFGYFIQKVYSF